MTVAASWAQHDSGNGTTEHDGSWQHTRIKFAAEEQPKLEEKAVENQAEEKSRITLRKRRSYKINKQGSDGEEVAQEEQHRHLSRRGHVFFSSVF